MSVEKPFHDKRFEIKQKPILLYKKIISKMQNKKEEINIVNKELQVLLNLIPDLTLKSNGIFLKQNIYHTKRIATQSYRTSA